LVRHRGVHADHRYRTVCAADRGGASPDANAGRWSMRTPRPRSYQPRPEWPRHLSGLRTRGHSYGASTDLPQLRKRWMLRLLGRAPCLTALQPDTASGDAQLRAWRVVALVLPRRTDRLSSVSSSPEFASLNGSKQSKSSLSASAVMRNHGHESRINPAG